MPPVIKKILDRDVLGKPMEKILHPRLTLKKPLINVGARNPYAVYRARRHNVDFSLMTPDQARQELYGLGDSKLEYTQLFDPRWGSCLFCEKTIEITRIHPVTIEANRDSVVDPTHQQATSSEQASGESLVGGPGDITVCENNLGNATWIPRNGSNNHASASLYRPWFDYPFDPAYPSYPDRLSPAFDDSYQGQIPDCYLLAALSSIAWYCAVNKIVPSKIVTNPDNTVSFLTTDNKTIEITPSGLGTVPTDYSIPIDASQPPVPVGAKTKTGNASWVPYYEKAFARYLEYTGKIVPASPYPDHPYICRIPCGDAGETLRALMKKSTAALTTYKFTGDLGSASRNPETVWAKLKSICETPWLESTDYNAWKTKYPAVASTNCTGDPNVTGNPNPPLCAAPRGSGVNYVDDLILASHAYSLLGIHKVKDRAPRYVILRNPFNENWGFIYGSTAYGLSDGPLVFYSIKVNNIRYNRPLFENKLPIRGVFALKLEDFVNYFAGFSWVIP